jgi:hypothetical protein
MPNFSEWSVPSYARRSQSGHHGFNEQMFGAE